MRRAPIFLLVAAACGPGAPPMQGTTTTGEGSTGAMGSTTGLAPTTGATTSDGPDGSSSAVPSGTSTTSVTSEASITGSSSGGASTTGEVGTTGELAPCCLAPDAPTSSVQAVTPVGARTLPWATFSISGGECGGAVFMHLFPDTAGIGLGEPDLINVDFLSITASTYMDMWPDDFIGTGPVSIVARFDGQSATTEGEITIFALDQGAIDVYWCDPEGVPVELGAEVSFTIALKSDGWDIAGEVVARYCPALNSICP